MMLRWCRVDDMLVWCYLRLRCDVGGAGWGVGWDGVWWGGVGGCNNVHVSCLTCDAMMMLR